MPRHGRGDKELTLGWGAAVAAIFGLAVLCGLCFTWGYMVGHRGVKTAAVADTAATPADQEPLQPKGSAPKPTAYAQDVVQHPADADAGAAAPTTGTGTEAAALDSAPGVAAQQVHPALSSESNVAEPQQAAPQVRPALPAAATATFMVQVAAVTNAEDAEVLVGALRKRNYAVAIRREPGDNLIHVKVGPFATLAEAEQWKMKLLNDGYNAVVQP